MNGKSLSKIVVSAETETWQAEGPSPEYLEGEPYSYRGRTAGHVTNVVAFLENPDRTTQYYGDSCGKDLGDVRPGERVFSVVAEYETGDSFGHDGGQATVLDVFRTFEEAQSLATAAREVSEYGFEHNGVHYSTPWLGYFETLNKIEVWECAVKGGPEGVGYRIGR